jgi:hypothetical protein
MDVARMPNSVSHLKSWLPGFLVCGLMALNCATVRGAEITAEWITSGIGEWEDIANWRDGISPGPAAQNMHVVLAVDSPEHTQSSLDSDMEVGRLTLGHVLYTYASEGNAPREFRVKDFFRWIGGELTGWGTRYHIEGDAIFEGRTYKTLDRTCELFIHNRARWTEGHLNWSGYGLVEISAGGLFLMETGGTVGSAGTTASAELRNRGVIRMDAAGQTARIYCPVVQEGLLDIQAGQVQTMWSFAASGAVNIEPGAALLLSGRSQWQNFPLTNRGELILTGSAEMLSDTSWSGKTVISGEITGPGNLRLNEAAWEGGSMSGEGVTTIVPEGHLRMKSGSLARPLSNEGTLIFSHGSTLAGGGAGVLTNTAGGTILLASNGRMGDQHFSGMTLVNHGLMLKEDGAGTFEVNAPVVNTGLVQATAGRIVLGSGGSSSGVFEAKAGAVIEARDVMFASTASLLGSGRIELIKGDFGGSTDPRLQLSIDGTTITRPGWQQVRTLHVNNWAGMSGSAGLEVTGRLLFSGSLWGGNIRSLGLCELSSDGVTITEGANLELLGSSVWHGGSLTLNPGSTLRHFGTMQLQGQTGLFIAAGATFENRGSWSADSSVGGIRLLIDHAGAQLTTSKSGGQGHFQPGEFQLSGPVTISTASIDARKGGRVVLETLTASDCSVRLEESVLEIRQELSTANALFVLDQAQVAGPKAVWTGSATLQGRGEIEPRIACDELRLNPDLPGSDLVLNNSLTLPGSNSVLRITGANLPRGYSTGALRVNGQVHLNGRFVFASELPVLSTNTLPLVIIESDRPISGSFVNAQSGQLLSEHAQNFRFRVFYGPGSPHGANKLVLAEYASPYDLWRSGRFTAEEFADHTISGPNADPDSNGFSNVAEFVLAIDPAKGREDLPWLQAYPEGYSLIRIRQRKQIGGLAARLAVSPTLTDWEETFLGSGSATLILHRAFDAGDAYEYIYRYPHSSPQLFLRIIILGSF